MRADLTNLTQLYEQTNSQLQNTIYENDDLKRQYKKIVKEQTSWNKNKKILEGLI